MDIKIGHLYKNKTFTYLIPCLVLYGETFRTKLNSIFNLGFGIHDCLLDGTTFENQRLIYILCDKLYQPAKFQNFLNYLKTKPYYVMDYAYDDIESGRKHMVVIRCPEQMNHAYDMFNESKYSLMYLDNQIDTFITGEQIRKVLKKDSSLADKFARELNSIYRTTLTSADVIDGKMELELPLTKEQEYFNYRKE